MPAIVTVNQTAYCSYPYQAVNDITTPSYKWFSLNNNLLDGTYHPLPANINEGEVGWWGTTISDANGYLSPAPTLTIEESRQIKHLRVSGDPLLNDYPVDFTVELFNGTTPLHTESVLGNSQVEWEVELPQVYDVTKIVLTVTRVNAAGRNLKITEAVYYHELFKTVSLSVGLSYSGNIGNTIHCDATLFVSRDVLAKDVTVELFSKASLQVDVNTESKPTNVHTKMDSPSRTIYGKVEIVYTDPFIDAGVTITASEEGRYTYAQQVIDNVETPMFKWFSLYDNILDGTYHPIPANGEYSVGWWGTTLSDVNGEFITPITLLLEFDQPRQIYELKVVGDSVADNYPVNFVIELLDAADVVLHTETVTNNSLSSWYKDINDISNVSKMRLSINKISKPGHPIRIMEFFTLVRMTYYSEDIEGIELLEELEYPTSSIALGNISCNEVDITLNNVNGYFNLGNTSSPLNGLLKKNRRVTVWLGTEILPGEIEWHQQGVFWTTHWKVPDQSVWAYVTARDRLELLRLTEFKTSGVYQNYSLYQLFELVLQDAGLVGSQYIIDSSLQDIVIPYAWFDRMSHRQAIQKLAGCALVQVYCNRQDQIIVTSVTPTPTIIYKFDEDKNLFDKDFPFVWNEITNYVSVVVQERKVGSTITVSESNETFTVPAGTQVTKTYTFNFVPSVNVLPSFTGGSNIQIATYTVYAWGIEITFQNSGAIDEQVTSVSIQGQPLELASSTFFVAKDDELIRKDGKIEVQIQHEFIQDSTYAQQLASDLLSSYKTSRHDVILNSRGNIALKLGDRIIAPGHLQDQLFEYMVKRQHLKWYGYLEAQIEGQKIEE